MDQQSKYNILIVDDNPFPTQKCIEILLTKLSELFKKSDIEDEIKSKFKNVGYDNVSEQYEEIRGVHLSFEISENVHLTLYNYDATNSKEINQEKIIELIKVNKINIFWTDRGHSLFKVEDNKMYEILNDHSIKSDALFENDKLVKVLLDNGIKQIAVYTYNPNIKFKEIEERRIQIAKKFVNLSPNNKEIDEKFKDEKVYFIETSSILNLFNINDYLTDGCQPDNLLGTIPAYEQYGSLYGYVLYDLFLQLIDDKYLSTNEDKSKRYNFFNELNRSFLRYIKLLNNNNFIYDSFKIGLVSFYSDYNHERNFLIDVPYKEYYQTYDRLLGSDSDPITSIFDMVEDEKEKYIYYRYKECSSNKYNAYYKSNIMNKEENIKRFLPLLHTGIFYQPEFYDEKEYPFDYFDFDKEKKCQMEVDNTCEIFYLFKKTNFNGISGVLHFSLWRRNFTGINEIKSRIDEMWELYYPLLEAKVQETLIPLLLTDIRKQATRAAISQVMARNMSHNIGSHVMSNLTDGKELSNMKDMVDCNAYEPNFKLDNEELNMIYQLASYNNYVKCRMDYLSDITFGTPVMQTNKKVIGELFQDLDKVRLLLNNISGLSKNFPYKINFTIEGGNTELTVAIPNDLLGCQAFYNIIENVIRNTAKHNQGKKNVNGTPIPTNIFVSFKDISAKEEIEEKNIWYEVEVYDDVDVPDIVKLVEEQNKKINLSVLAENNQLRNSSLGLLEMEASAAYLRKLDIINIEHPDYKVNEEDNSIHTNGKLNILKAFSKDVDGKNCLAYRFFVSKPTEYLFIDDDLNVSEIRKTELLKMGIWLKSKLDFTNEISKTVFNHQFVFYKADSGIKTLIEMHQTHLPVRIIELNKEAEPLMTLIKTEKQDFTKIEKCVWEIWFKKIGGAEKCVNTMTSYNSEVNIYNHPNKYNIVLLNHNEGWAKSIKDYPGNINYLEPLSSMGQKTLPEFKSELRRYLGSEWNELKKYKLYEAAVSNVLVIDERIQRFSATKYEATGESVLINDIFNCTNTIIPDSNPYTLDADNFDKSLTNSICAYINERVENYNFLLIHYSILERMFNEKDPNDSTRKDPRIIEYLKRLAEKTRVVVTSGRGKPRELPEQVCYVNLSPVLNVFTQTRSKYSINYLLNQARK